MHDSSTIALCVFPCLEPRNLFSIPPLFSRVTVIYSPALATISSSVSFLKLLPASLLLSAYSAFCLLLCVFFICTCACSIFSYLMLLRHLDSSATPGSCDAVTIAMCLHAATQKVKIQNVLTKISKIRAPTGPNHNSLTHPRVNHK